jgi:hypothetical protein
MARAHAVALRETLWYPSAVGWNSAFFDGQLTHFFTFENSLWPTEMLHFDDNRKEHTLVDNILPNAAKVALGCLSIFPQEVFAF